jgi:ribose transport system substrate-binding protein
MAMNNPYFPALNNSIKEVITANGDILITRDPAQDQLKQNEQISDLIEEGVTAIFLQPVDWKGVEPALLLCRDAGIPVFNVDSFVYRNDLVVCSILSDNYDAGVQIAYDVLRKTDNARIVIINHKEINSTNLRVQGFLDTLRDHPDYEVVSHMLGTAELEVAMEFMLGILEQGVDFDIILGGNDPTALGVLAAIQKKAVTKSLLIYGIDGSPDGKQMIGRGFIEGSSAQRPIEMGKKAAQTAYDYLAGKNIQKEILIPVTLITRENLAEFDADGWQ